jgi:hypothetical protein
VPLVKGAIVAAIAPDPAHADGVVAVLEDCCVAFVRAKAKP